MSIAAALPRRWDPLVKLTHWGVAVAVIANALVTEEGSGWHIWVGYGLAALLALRLCWGLIGPAEARFSAFPPSPRRALAHMGEIRRGEVIEHRSHNPLGALMVYAIWTCLVVIIATGIAMAGPPPADPNATANADVDTYIAGKQGVSTASPQRARAWVSKLATGRPHTPPWRARRSRRPSTGPDRSAAFASACWYSLTSGIEMFLLLGRISTSEVCTSRNTTRMVIMSMNGTSAMWLPPCERVRCRLMR